MNTLRRSIPLLALLTLFCVGFSGFPSASTWAQENGDEIAAAEAGEEPAERQNYLSWALGALGVPYFLVFLSLSFTLVALLVMNLLTASRNNVCPVALVEGLSGWQANSGW